MSAIAERGCYFWSAGAAAAKLLPTVRVGWMHQKRRMKGPTQGMSATSIIHPLLPMSWRRRAQMPSMGSRVARERSPLTEAPSLRLIIFRRKPITPITM